jgi:DNA-binding MarR family transcriptional regulator
MLIPSCEFQMSGGFPKMCDDSEQLDADYRAGTTSCEPLTVCKGRTQRFMAARPKRGRARPGRTRADVELWVSILRFASLISRPMRDGVADPARFGANELRVLMALSGEGESAGHDLAELMGLHAMNVSRALTSLLEMGFVKQVSNRKNRRRKPFRISAKGRAAFQSLEPNIAAIARFIFATLTTSERAILKTIVAKLDRQIQSWQPSERHPHVPRA